VFGGVLLQFKPWKSGVCYCYCNYEGWGGGVGITAFALLNDEN